MNPIKAIRGESRAYNKLFNLKILRSSFKFSHLVKIQRSVTSTVVVRSFSKVLLSLLQNWGNGIYCRS